MKPWKLEKERIRQGKTLKKALRDLVWEGELLRYFDA